MKTVSKALFLRIGLFAALLFQYSIALAQGTAFTYQGRLNDGAGPANGTYDLRFALYNANTGGSQIGLAVTNSAIVVTGGLFTTTMDFGANFPGAGRWLELAVRTNGGAAFLTLSSRQQLTPAPYSITASNLSGTLPTSQLSGTVGNSQLANSSITVNAGTGLSGGGAVTLGSSTTLNNVGVLSVAGNGDITATTLSGAVTLGSTATSANTANTIVKRDANRNFSAGTITLSGTLNLPATSGSAGAGVISLGGLSLIHAFGNFNFFAGTDAGNFSLSGDFNTGVGFSALETDTTGSGNTAVGTDPLLNNTTGNYNIAIGLEALYENITGTANVAVGTEALFNCTNGDNNVALGCYALESNTTGTNNIGVGAQAGANLSTGNNNIEIGNTGFSSDDSTIRIGKQGLQTEAHMAGIYGTTLASGVAVYVNSSAQLGTLTSSARFKQDIRSMDEASDVLLSLRPVKFRYKTEIDPAGLPQFGLIAEEVDKVDPDLVVRDDQHGIYTVRYEAVNAMLLNEFLKEHRKLEAESAKVDALEKRLEQLERAVQSHSK